jgi:poly(beta-D-mannuronate) lyase
MQRLAQVAFALFLAPWLGLAADTLRAPFNLHAPVDGLPAATCPSPPAPVVELAVVSKYGNNGPLHDTVSPDADAEAMAQMAPVRAFAQAVVRMANHYTATGDSSSAHCALTWLNAWAVAHALTRMQDHNAEFERGATLAGLSLALIQVSPAGAPANDPRYAAVSKWMHSLATASIQYFDSTQRLQGSRNNHRYWAGLGAAGTALVTGDRHLLDWSVDTYKRAVCGATAEGGLPLELERGKKALDYHLFALDALTPIAAIAESNGIEAFAFCDGALHRIVRFTLTSLDNPSTIAKLAGKPQDPYPGGLPSKNHASFLEIYHHYFPGKAPLEARLLAMRPLSSTNLGGDQTLLYASKSNQ